MARLQASRPAKREGSKGPGCRSQNNIIPAIVKRGSASIDLNRNRCYNRVRPGRRSCPLHLSTLSLSSTPRSRSWFFSAGPSQDIFEPAALPVRLSMRSYPPLSKERGRECYVGPDSLPEKLAIRIPYVRFAGRLCGWQAALCRLTAGPGVSGKSAPNFAAPLQRAWGRDRPCRHARGPTGRAPHLAGYRAAQPAQHHTDPYPDVAAG